MADPGVANRLMTTAARVFWVPARVRQQRRGRPQILALYDTLQHVAPSPVVTLSRAVAVAMVHGPLPALAAIGTLEDDAWAACSHRLPAVRAHLLEMSGQHLEAREDCLRAARMTASLPEQHYLQLRAARLAPGPGGPGP